MTKIMAHRLKATLPVYPDLKVQFMMVMFVAILVLGLVLGTRLHTQEKPITNKKNRITKTNQMTGIQNKKH